MSETNPELLTIAILQALFSDADKTSPSGKSASVSSSASEMPEPSAACEQQGIDQFFNAISYMAKELDAIFQGTVRSFFAVCEQCCILPKITVRTSDVSEGYVQTSDGTNDYFIYLNYKALPAQILLETDREVPVKLLGKLPEGYIFTADTLMVSSSAASTNMPLALEAGEMGHTIKMLLHVIII